MDLLAFPPVCLPTLGQSFSGLDGIVAGEVHVPLSHPYLIFVADAADIVRREFFCLVETF